MVVFVVVVVFAVVVFCCFCCCCRFCCRFCCCCCYYCFCEITKIISPSLYALDLLKIIVKQVKQFMRPFPTKKKYFRLYDPPYRGKGGVRPMHGGHPTVQKLVVTIFCLIYFPLKYHLPPPQGRFRQNHMGDQPFFARLRQLWLYD